MRRPAGPRTRGRRTAGRDPTGFRGAGPTGTAGEGWVTVVTVRTRPPVRALVPRRRVHLYTRPHIDLQRVAGALCRS
ncbi:putative leader peptide [uncultured Streptomyces sp.]|uniref:putative leader peptide n=1 Tax=uncultured Streptomyces sp. TaxID=174707 RepID=UPI0034359D89